jgi:hypothetical protein
VLGGDVLGTEREGDVGSVEEDLQRPKRRERRMDDDLDLVVSRGETTCQILDQRDGLEVREVHLPVPGY